MAGGSGVILCPLPLPISYTMAYTFSSHSRNALLSENNYEIGYKRLWVSGNMLLHGSVTMMGTIIYTFTGTSGDVGGSRTPPHLTWTDTILTYNDQEVLNTSLPIAEKRTMLHWYLTDWETSRMQNRTGGARYWNSAREETNFSDLLERSFREITCYLLNVFYSFANGSLGPNGHRTTEEIEIPFESHYP